MESLPLGTIQPGDSLAQRWTLRGDDASDGEYRFSFRVGGLVADTVSQGFGYYSNGAVTAEALRLVVRDTTYTAVLQEERGLMEAAHSMRSGSLLRHRYTSR